jgi:hypothetical protein
VDFFKFVLSLKCSKEFKETGMYKLLSSIVCLAILLVATDTRAAADNLTLNKYLHSSELPSSFYTLGGASSMASKKYTGDDGKQRSDKVYYTITHSYSSSYTGSDIDSLLNPASGHLGELLDKTDVKKSRSGDSYDIVMAISTPLKTFMCENTLTFKKTKVGNKSIYKYSFTDFNMVFTDMVIQVEVVDTGSDSKVSIFQIAALKGSTYEKLKSYFAVGKFGKAVKLNLATIKYGIGGR